MSVKQLAVAWASCLRVALAAATRKLRVTRQRTSEGGRADLLLRGEVECAECDRRGCVTVRAVVSR
jgi:hypothetical protein